MTPEDKQENRRRVQWAITAAFHSATTQQGKSQIQSMSVHTFGYKESGYSDPASGLIVCGNWNKVTEWDEESRRFDDLDTAPERLGNVLEKLGVELEWSDEWTECEECCGLVRSEPDSYGWRPSYIVEDECSIVCQECADPETYLESIEENSGVINQLFDPDDNGYVLVEDYFENGFHQGQDASPQLIGELLTKAGFSRWLFNLDGKGQFDIRFSVWLHKEEADRDDGDGLILAKRALERGGTDGPSVSAAMERGLRETGRQADELQASDSSGILVTKVGMDGTETKEISREDFVNGKTLD